MLKGSKFQIKVWKEIKKIPKGKVTTYKNIAKKIGFPKGF
jgi:O6-methylguanine-DNA--protein-cysteine methyltransferase